MARIPIVCAPNSCGIVMSSLPPARGLRAGSSTVPCFIGFFPYSSGFSIEYIRKYEPEIQDALDNEEIRQYGEIISNPTEVEIGTLYLYGSVRTTEG